jgi:3-oxoacyl-[acyl-carrier-protein] synthase-3
MSNLYLNNFGYALGSISRDAVQSEQSGDLLSSANALYDAGFNSHHICAINETPYDLACNALKASLIRPSEIDCICYATCIPGNGSLSCEQNFEDSRDVKHLMNFPASRLQSEFEMNKAFVIGLNQQACTGMLGSIRVARNMLLAEPELDNVLCITADRFPNGAIYEQAYNLISDGAAACTVSRQHNGFRILAMHHITNGAMATSDDDQTVGSYFNYTHQIITETLSRAGLGMSDIRWVVPQNTNRKAWQILASLLQVSEEQAWFDSIGRCGHVISADNIINLADLESSGQLRSGDKLLTFMAGFGSNWQCLILERV